MSRLAFSGRLQGHSPFEEAFDKAAGSPRCAGCGAPDPNAPLVIHLEPGEPYPECRVCGGPTDRAGAAVGRGGPGDDIHIKVYRISATPGWDRELEGAPR
jgi:hypothetical protein